MQTHRVPNSLILLLLFISCAAADEIFTDQPGAPMGDDCPAVLTKSINERSPTQRLSCVVVNGQIALIEFDSKGKAFGSDIVSFKVDPDDADRSIMTITSDGPDEGGTIDISKIDVRLDEPNQDEGVETATYTVRNSKTAKRAVYTITSDEGPDTETPESSTLLLLAGGIGIIVWRRNPRRRSAMFSMSCSLH